MHCVPTRNLLIFGPGVPAALPRSVCSPPRFGFGEFPPVTMCGESFLGFKTPHIIIDLVCIPAGRLPAQVLLRVLGSGGPGALSRSKCSPPRFVFGGSCGGRPRDFLKNSGGSCEGRRDADFWISALVRR